MKCFVRMSAVESSQEELLDEMEELILEDKDAEVENVVILGVCAMNKKVAKCNFTGW